MRRVASKTRAMADQLMAALRDADGFPLSTGELARAQGGRLVCIRKGTPPARPRPECWGAETRPGMGIACCERCRGFHMEPVWRMYQAEDVRHILNGLAAAGEVEKIELAGVYKHYWRLG